MWSVKGYSPPNRRPAATTKGDAGAYAWGSSTETFKLPTSSTAHAKTKLGRTQGDRTPDTYVAPRRTPFSSAERRVHAARMPTSIESVSGHETDRTVTNGAKPALTLGASFGIRIASTPAFRRKVGFGGGAGSSGGADGGSGGARGGGT